VPSLVAAMRETLPPAAVVFVGEPTSMQVVTQHKGGLSMRTEVHGHEVHSSLVHTGVSAVMNAARLVNWHAERMAENRAAAEALGEDAPGAPFAPPYTTLHNGMIEGGTAANITARDCWFTSDIRFLPGESGDHWLARYRAECARVEAEMQTVRPGTCIAIDVRLNAPGCREENDGEAERLARLLTGDNGAHAVSYGTEAGHFQNEGGYSVCVCGPGSIEQAHQADEYISVAQLAAGEAFMRRLIDHLCN
jgi:acetylornithine deacetylase